MGKWPLSVGAAAVALSIVLASGVQAEDAVSAPDSVELQFQNPPNSARPRVWWHWMNGNVTKEGIAQDLDWMVKVGIGGLQHFDIDLYTPVLVPKRLAYMTPEWKEAFRYTAQEADRRGLELAIASSPGWSETGGPWVEPKDGLKKLVWSETVVPGGKRFRGTLPSPPDVSGPFQDLAKFDPMAAATGQPQKVAPRHSGDVAVFAVRRDLPLPTPKVTGLDGKTIDFTAASDDDLTSALDLPRGSPEAPSGIVLDYGKPVTIRSASLFSLGARAMFVGASIEPRLEASDDGKTWRPVTGIEVAMVPATESFPAVRSRYFRLLLKPLAPGGTNLGNAAPGIAPLPFFDSLSGVGTAPIKLNDFRLSGEPKIHRYEAKAGFSIAGDYYALDGQDDGAAAATVVDLTSRMTADGSLDWTPPAGSWTIFRMGYSLLGTTNHPAPAEATGLEVDKFDGEAVRRYLEHYVGMYRDAAGSDLLGRKGVQAILTDSIEVGAANWTPRLVEQFKRLRGYDPVPWLPTLAGVVIGSRQKSDKFLYDYRRTLADLMVTEHYGTIAKVARENGLKIYGEALEDHRPSLGDDMSMRQFADVPMSALWTFPKDGKPSASHVVDMKGAASVAHIYGQNLAAAESMTSALRYWADSPRTLKRVIDLEFVTGINRPIVHTSVHSPDEAGEPGLSLMVFGQHFNRHDAWAGLAKPWIDYMSRNSFLLQQGVNVADVGYFYGEEAPLTALYGDNPIADAPKSYAYDFVSADALMEALSNDGGDLVSKGGARYRVLYLGGSSSRMTLPMLKRLKQLAEGGATIVGKKPTQSPSLADDPQQWDELAAQLWPGSPTTKLGRGQIIAGSDVEAALAGVGLAADLSFSGAKPDSDLPFIHRRLADGDSYFIVNRKGSPESVEAHFRVTGKAPELWRAETGTTEPLSFRIENGQTVVPLELSGEESVHVVFRKPASAANVTVTSAETQVAATLSGPWEVVFQPGRAAPAAITMETLIPLNESADAGVKHFAGVATYRSSFTTPKGWRPGQDLWIDLGDAREVAEVQVNGQSVGFAWHAPYKVNLKGAARRGRNTLNIRVGTLWVNRMIGDAQPNAEKITRTTLPTYSADAPLQPAGLIGPVRLLTSPR